MMITERLHEYFEDHGDLGTVYSFYRWIGEHLYWFHYVEDRYSSGKHYKRLDVYKTPGDHGGHTDRVHIFRELHWPNPPA